MPNQYWKRKHNNWNHEETIREQEKAKRGRGREKKSHRYVIWPTERTTNTHRESKEAIGASGGGEFQQKSLPAISVPSWSAKIFSFFLKSKLNIFLLLRFICGSSSVMKPLHDDEEEEDDENICLRSLMWLTWNLCMIVSQQQQRCAVFKTKLCLRRLSRAYKVLSFHTHIHFVDYNTYIHDT